MKRPFYLRVVLMLLSLAEIHMAGLGNAQTGNKIFPEEVLLLHESVLTVDTHCDTPMRMLQGFDIGQRHSTGCVDLPRMKEGGLDAMFFAIFVPQKARTESTYREAYLLARQMTDSVLASVGRHGDLAEIALHAGDAERIASEGKRAVYLGLENGFPLALDLNRTGEFYNRGIRYITLSHSRNNDLCDSSSDQKGAEHHGLSSFGRQVVLEMNRLGMIIDVSHISDEAFSDVLSISLAPVIASHSNARALAPHHRNMSDEMIKQLAKKGGVIQVCLLDDYVKKPDANSDLTLLERELYLQYEERWQELTEEEKQEYLKKKAEIRKQYSSELPSLTDFVNHIDHVVKIAGINHVGIGSDFDGGGGLTGCPDVSWYPAITGELMKRGYNEKEIRKIWGGNFFRVFRKVEEVARKISQATAD